MNLLNVDIAHVTRINRNTSSPRLVLQPPWLGAMGFINGALVQCVPEHDGMTFTLCDKHIRQYSELYHLTKEKGGILMQVSYYRDGLQLCISGTKLEAAGLTYGDNLMVCYEHGHIRMRKLPKGPVQLVTPHLIGKWLTESGFVPDAVLSVDSVPGLITCTLHENGLENTTELVRYARANKLALLQVQKRKHKQSVIQWFGLPPAHLEKAGFAPDDALLATHDYGTIKLQKPDFAALGF